ncbi:MAG: hypothetical protein IPH12_03090 [Saprospirales bacterium]|nr:hypothetical protein [Saprospirales bacterium]
MAWLVLKRRKTAWQLGSICTWATAIQRPKYPYGSTLGAHPDDPVGQFYLGMSLLYREAYATAFGLLSRLAGLEAFNLQDEARWYAALAATKADPKAALELFGRIAQDAGSKYQQAAAAVLASSQLHAGAPVLQLRQNAYTVTGPPATCFLVIDAPATWWQSAWLRSLLAILFLAGAAGLILWRNRVQRHARESIESAVSARTLEIQRQRDKLEKDKERSEALLLNILPAETAAELLQHGHSDTRRYEMVTVLFCDFQGFTKISEAISPEQLVAYLGTCFEAFDRIMTTHRLEKIKTVGDCYICAGGLTATGEDNAVRVIQAAQDMLAFLQDFNAHQASDGKPAFEARIGIHTGPVVAGIVGIKKYAYDIWGDTVNIAARMEQASEGGRINLSGATYELVKNDFTFQYRGKIEAKGKGEQDMYYVV